MPRLVISLLGPLQVQVEGQPTVGFEYNKVRALLTYLCVERGPHSRDQLCALLWPELPESAARQNLSQALTQLRKALREKSAAEPLLLTTPDSVQLNPAGDVEVDVARFTAFITESEKHSHRAWHLCTPCAERLREAVALYHGDFLAQFFLSDSAPFEEWALLSRERLRQRMLSALERLAHYAEWRGSFAEAVAAAQQQVELEPLRDAAHRELMRLLALSGQHSAALAQYEQLRRMLAEALQVEPEAETTALHAMIQNDDPAMLRRLQPPPSYLPAPPTPLIGREAEIEAVCALVRDGAARLVTLTGAPGVGKTRLALEVAHALRYDFADGATFVELASLVDHALVPSAIVQAFGVKERGGQSLAEAVTVFLQAKHMLLVLDNFEQVLDAAAFVADLLTACPALTVLVTSRASLHIRAEQQHPLAPLAEAEAVALFVERARAVRGAFALTPENAPDIAAICRRVDGLPLAVELIAARIEAHAPAGLLAQLDHQLASLVDGPRDLPARQQTLRSAIQWSVDLLPLEAQRVFAHLGVFAGGCTAEAAQAVMSEAPPVLVTLHEASLVYTQFSADETRTRLLETIREFALERLTARGEMPAGQQRHAQYYLALAERAQPELDGSDQLVWFDRLEREHPNLRAALTWGLTHDPMLGLQLAVALLRFWSVRGHLSEGRRWLHGLLTAGENAPQRLKATALVVASRLAYSQADYAQALALAQQSREIFLQLEAEAGVAQSLLAFGLAHIGLGDYVLARAHVEESLAFCRGEADRPGMAEAFNALAHIVQRQGDYAAAKTFLGQALDLYRELNDPRNTAGMSLNLGVSAFEQGDYETAHRLTEESLMVFRQLHDKNGIATTLINLGNTLLETGKLVEARHCFEEAVVIERSLTSGHVAVPLGGLGRVLRRLGDLKRARACFAESIQLRFQSGDRRGVAVTLTNLAYVERDDHRPDHAARLLGAAEALREAIGAPIHPNRRDEYDQLVAQVRAALSDSAFVAAWAEGRALTLEQAVALAVEAS